MSDFKLTIEEAAILDASGQTTVFRPILPAPRIIGAQDGTRYLQIPGRGIYFEDDPNNTCALCRLGDAFEGGKITRIRAMKEPWRWAITVAKDRAVGEG